MYIYVSLNYVAWNREVMNLEGRRSRKLARMDEVTKEARAEGDN